MMTKSSANKAHAAVVRRIVERYGPCLAGCNGFDVVCGDLIVEVETSATLRAGIEKLQAAEGRRFVAVTNREAIEDALELTAETDIGVMSPWGDILRNPGHV
jgi:hypothetical protein